MAARREKREQGIYRRITVRMWGDAKVMALSRPAPCGQVLWLHLLTGEQTDIIPGLCKIGEAAFAEQLGWTTEGFREAFREVSALGMAKADWNARVVWVPKAIEHNAPASPNVVLSWADAWDRIPECALKVEAWACLRGFIEGMAEAFAKAFDKACPKPSVMPSRNQEQEQEQEEEALPPARAREPEPAPEPEATAPGPVPPPPPTAPAARPETFTSPEAVAAQYPATVAVLAWLEEHGHEAALSRERVTRAAVEKAIGAVGIETACERIVAAWDPALPWLGWYLEAIRGKAQGGPPPKPEVLLPAGPPAFVALLQRAAEVVASEAFRQDLAAATPEERDGVLWLVPADPYHEARLKDPDMFGKRIPELAAQVGVTVRIGGSPDASPRKAAVS